MGILTQEEFNEIKKIHEDMKVTMISAFSWQVGTDIVTKNQFGGFKCTCLNSRVIGRKLPCLHIMAVQDYKLPSIYRAK
ncbi:MAG: hypothetical protein BWX89_00006 [candidate division TA06 bacterium ADurb.Bin131]|jgi:hypothetical protein|uniref:SWIM-type domain-containing protein n=1 Tax=candidate division TA06 bacterium ADurb.Bin131 TaxID=1852827 RepID=A0A1V6CFI6_UNCT6|nr:MAG: hypothetical protein BWX89_00006 [candidate division TA06 bacterium ADurb.Bin131]